MTRPTVISVAITGSVPRKADNPSVPVTHSADGLVHLSDEVPERCYLSLSPDRIGLARVLDVLRGSLAQKFPRLAIAFAASPPFRELSSEEERRVIHAIFTMKRLLKKKPVEDTKAALARLTDVVDGEVQAKVYTNPV